MVLTIIYWVIGVYIYLLKSKHIPFYVALLYIIGLPISSYFLSDIDNEEVGFIGFTFITSIQRSFIFVICIIEIVRKNAILKFRQILLVSVALVFYLIFWNIYHSLSFKNVYISTFVFFDIIPFLVYIRVNGKINPSLVLKFFYFVIVIEVIAVFFNLFGIYFYEASYRGLHNLTISKISGTFHRFNALSNYLTLILLFICLEYLTNRIISKPRYWVILIVITTIVILTGSRASLIFLVLSVFLSYFIFTSSYKKFLVVFAVLIVSVLFYFIIRNNINYDTSDAQNGLQRIIFGFAELFSKTEKSTVSISDGIFHFFLNESVLFGVGFDMTGVVLNSQFPDVIILMSDARFIFMIAQYGFLGLIFYVVFFLGVLSFMSRGLVSKDKKKLRIIFFLLSILTITESGLFDFNLFVLVSLYSFYLHKKSEIIVPQTQGN